MDPLEQSTTGRSSTLTPKGSGVPAPLSERVRSLRLPQEANGTAASTQRLPWILCAVLAATTLGFGYAAFLRRPSQADPPAERAATDKSLSDRPATATLGTGEIVLESKGYIIPTHQILVSPQVSGRIERLNIQEGQRVVKDQTVLAELEKTDYEADLARAKAMRELARWTLAELTEGSRREEKDQAKAELQEAIKQCEQLKSDRQRQYDLWKQQIVSDQEYEEADSKYKAMQERVNRLTAARQLVDTGPRKERIMAAEAQVQQAEAEVAKAQWRLDKCTIRAPINGTILKKNAEKGNIVNPIAFNGSYSICDMADLSDLEVDMTIQERDISRVFQGQKCKVRTEAYPDRVYDGEVSRLMPIADRAKGAIPVRVKVTVPREEEGVYLKPEMGATVSFLRGTPAPSRTGSGAGSPQ